MANICFTWQQKALEEQVAEFSRLKSTLTKHVWDLLSAEKRQYLKKWKHRKRRLLLLKYRKLSFRHKEWQKIPTSTGQKYKSDWTGNGTEFQREKNW